MPISLYFRLPYHRIHGLYGRYLYLVWMFTIRPRLLMNLRVCRIFHRLNNDRDTSKDNEIVIFCDGNSGYLWGADNCFWVASEFCKFGLNITKCSCNWQSSREGSMRAKYKAMLFSLIENLQIGICISYLCPILFTSLLINFSSTFNDPFLLIIIACFMIYRQLSNNLTSFRTHYGPAVSNIWNIAFFAIKHGY